MEFQKGDIAILTGSNIYPERIGEECEIIDLRPINANMQLQDYLVVFKNIPHDPKYRGWCVNEWQLRKKYDGNELSSWEELKDIWNPMITAGEG